MISCQKSCRHSAKVGNFQKIKRKSVRFIFILHFTLHSNLLTFGIWQGKVSTFFFRPKKLLPKKSTNLDYLLTLGQVVPIPTQKHFTAHSHTYSRMSEFSHTHTHTTHTQHKHSKSPTHTCWLL